MKPLWEQYRPRDWSELIGNEKAVNQIALIKQRGLAGRAFWISGPSGTGKNSMAYLIGYEIAESEFIQVQDVTDLTPARLKEIERDFQQYGGLFGGKSGRCLVIDEAHGLRKDTVRQLLVLLERLPKHVVIIFTTTLEGQTTFEGLDDSSPLLSRCIEIQLTSQGLCEKFAQRAQQIAKAENLDGKPLSTYINLVKKCRNNMRMVLSEIEKGAMKA